MKTGILSTSLLVAGVLAASPSFGQGVKPAESTSKVKKVLLYNKIGGWVHVDGRKNVTAVVTGLSKSKKFELTVLEDDAAITLDFLKTFQVIIWDNNTDGGKSIPNVAARQAVMDYVNQGGGWYLIHGAGDHSNSWDALKTSLGTKFTTHGAQGPASITLDAEAKGHKELKWMVDGLPEKMTFTDEWYSFDNTVRKLSGVTIVYTAGGAGTNILKLPADNSNDYTYVWARTIGKGRMFYSAIGHGEQGLFGQADSSASKLLWQNIRYTAGDFQNGCITATASNFDPAARVDDGSCLNGTGLNQGFKTSPNLTLVHSGRKTQIAFPHSGDYTVTLRDMRGSVVRSMTLAAGTSEVSLDRGLQAGIYQVEARSGRTVAHARMVLH